MLVADDTPKSDGYALRDATDVEHGGMRVTGDKKNEPMKEIRAWSDESAARQKALGQPATASRNGIVVEPDAIR
ncbi:hypothetical protein [Burkholderia oklahomensis]|uniref:Thiol-disulfide isomerase and thioredoxin domain protein n=1 Tax=Burkholderia oklahomensis TaxID=342113 RepID=A0AAI8FM32_9BURK|nr:hypothetical protein [Burkholderia oklahomensis]AIO65644.1 thiol-disulfide isomerase and thioredoxin domain protein [Burkholderia oklahomensis]AJX32296.1 phosphorylcholine phosphatase domain protein [Burkholderia oklahomensis C6786]AOI41251.1 hypothetical protein WG70_16175 [Burkholderia oklahomensis EO147]AOI44857.1 hypothetical protein WI23_03010 [Burkholderia oklahomensis C6786]KUY63741.1 hypothetical protein WG70_29845 [Burkholderia oklahomensis EO147]